MMNNQRGYTITELLTIMVIPLFLAAAGGWIWNIVKIVQSDFSIINGMFIARCIGVFVAPLGAVLGFF